MANHITNRIVIHADDIKVRKILETIKNDKIGLGSIDFDKIIPMPDNIFRGDLGQEEMEQYGENNWYDWSVEHRGTKWNAYGYESFVPYEGGNTIEFLTAWSRPEPVVIKLSQMFPDAQFQHAWADEDIGSNVGEILYQNGEEMEYDVPIPHSKEAYEMAAEIHDIELSDFGLFFDEKSRSYEYKEEMEGMSLQ